MTPARIFARSLFSTAFFSAGALVQIVSAQAQTQVQSQVQSQPFPFVIPWDDAAKTATDVSFLNPAPLQNQHRVGARDGHFYDQTGRRVRFLGVNFVYSTNFMDKGDAEKVAARLHKFGINMVRLHHMDTLRAPNGIFPAEGKGTTQLDADQLDRLDYLIAQLKKNGVYVNLNLLVGRRFDASDGLTDAGNLPNYGRVISWFDPKTIELQKDYARQILGRVNRYTGLRYADDPAVAVVEFNNEDTILGPNRAETLRNLPPFYRQQIYDGWNGWLKKKYASTAQMLAAWNRGALPYGENRVANANLENFAGEIGASVSGLSFKRGETLRLQFRAKTSSPRALNVAIKTQIAPVKTLGLDKNVPISSDWKTFSLAFKAPADIQNGATLLFSSKTAGEIQLADVKLQAGNAIELEAGQSIETGVDLPLYSATGQGADFAQFTMDLEARYVETMRAFLKDELKTGALVTCSQSGWGGLGGLLRESRLDFVDMHAYWDHPDTFDAKSWKIGNKPMTRQNDGATLATLAQARVAGKPYTVSEYNHSAPNEFQAETLPFLAGFAAWQDWDGIYLFDYHSNRKTIAGANRIEKLFSVDANPAKMAFFPAAALLFLGGGLPPASPATLSVPRAQVDDLMAQHNGALWSVWSKTGFSNPEMLRHQVGVKFEDGGEFRLQKGTAPDVSAAPFSWQTDQKESAFLRLNAPTSQFLVGFPSAKWQSGDFSVQTTSPDFAALTLSSRDQKPLHDSQSLLLTAVSKVENRGMKWNETRTSVGENWGEGPTVAWGVGATITIPSRAQKATVHALDGSGARTQIVPSQLEGGKLNFQIGPQFQTVWYEIETQ